MVACPRVVGRAFCPLYLPEDGGWEFFPQEGFHLFAFRSDY